MHSFFHNIGATIKRKFSAFTRCFKESEKPQVLRRKPSPTRINFRDVIEPVVSFDEFCREMEITMSQIPTYIPCAERSPPQTREVCTMTLKSCAPDETNDLVKPRVAKMSSNVGIKRHWNAHPDGYNAGCYNWNAQPKYNNAGRCDWKIPAVPMSPRHNHHANSDYLVMVPI
ncbi:hypothetical protein IWW43_003258 [Coemansia sp. RSA 1935]|nr:hypothetical protein IW143_004922 [Coemansia sp. RSA 520]KAJ2532322.1 hypothetical protein IWW43_003258 [Coemansia sp. RSA 1935]